MCINFLSGVISCSVCLNEVAYSYRRLEFCSNAYGRGGTACYTFMQHFITCYGYNDQSIFRCQSCQIIYSGQAICNEIGGEMLHGAAVAMIHKRKKDRVRQGKKGKEVKPILAGNRITATSGTRRRALGEVSTNILQVKPQKDCPVSKLGKTIRAKVGKKTHACPTDKRIVFLREEMKYILMDLAKAGTYPVDMDLDFPACTDIAMSGMS